MRVVDDLGDFHELDAGRDIVTSVTLSRTS